LVLNRLEEERKKNHILRGRLAKMEIPKEGTPTIFVFEAFVKENFKLTDAINSLNKKINSLSKKKRNKNEK